MNRLLNASKQPNHPNEQINQMPITSKPFQQFAQTFQTHSYLILSITNFLSCVICVILPVVYLLLYVSAFTPECWNQAQRKTFYNKFKNKDALVCVISIWAIVSRTWLVTETNFYLKLQQDINLRSWAQKDRFTWTVASAVFCVVCDVFSCALWLTRDSICDKESMPMFCTKQAANDVVGGVIICGYAMILAFHCVGIGFYTCAISNKEKAIK